MSVVILVILFFIYIGSGIYDILTTNHKAFTSSELEQMQKEMIGKSQAECREIYKKYARRK